MSEPVSESSSAPPRITFLGTGTSIGVPVIGCGCGVCVSDDPKNKRLRSSIWFQDGDFSVIVDTGPDFRQQCLRAGIEQVDAVLFTHAHSDHIMGFDDLRRFTVWEEDSLDIYATEACLERLKVSFDYVFNGENRYIGYFKPAPQVIDGPFTISDEENDTVWEILPLPVTHGKVETIGFLFSKAGTKRFAYIPDAKTLSDEAKEAIWEVPVLILDGLQEDEHPTHLSIAEACEIAAEAEVGRLLMTHFSCRVDYQELGPTLPANAELAYDEMVVEV